MKYIIFIIFYCIFFISCSTNTNSSKIVKEKITYQGEKENDSIKIDKKEKRDNSKSEFIKSIFNGKIEIVLPNTFVLLDKESLKIKYPYGNSESMIVFTDEESEVNLAFEKTNKSLSKQDLPNLLNTIVKQFQSNQSIEIIDYNIKEANFGTIEFTSQAIDTKIYNLMFIAELEGQALTGSFNCTEQKLSKWKAKGKSIINSIQIKN